MREKQIENILEQAKTLFLKNDKYLLSVEVNERSLTHKFAEHLQITFGDTWNVDCEYNRFGKDKKRIIAEIKEFIDPYSDGIQTDDIKANTVYPDIIVHKRGTKGQNLLVIEAKKDTDADDRRKDMKKLEKIKDEYKYCFAVFINFRIKTKSIEWCFVDKIINFTL